MPLSKLFHKRNSLKDKKASNSSNIGPCSNEAASTSNAKCDQKVEETVNKDSAPTEQLPTTSETATGVICDSKEKAEQQPSSTTETAKDSPTDSSQCEEDRNAGLTELASNAENTLEVSTECEHGEIQMESSPSTEHLMSNTEVVIEPIGMKNEQVDSVESSTEQLLPIAKTVKNASCDVMSEDDNNATSTATEKLSPATDSIIDGHSEPDIEKSVNLSFSEPAYPKTESLRDESCDSKDETTTVNSSVAEKISLKHEKNPDMPREVTQSDNQLTKHVQEQNDELVLNSKETGCSIGASLHSDNNGSSSAHENVEMETNREKTSKIKSRGSSFKETGSKPAHSKTRRRKCESESAASNSNSTDDEGFDDRVLHFREKDLEEVIGKCVNKLIRESIAMAVRNVDVDGLYEEVIKTISDRSQSESSNTSECPGTVEQKLHTNSVKEYADLEMLDTFEDSLELQDEPPTEKHIEGKIVVNEVEEPRTEAAEENNDCAAEKVDLADGNNSGIAYEEGEDKDIDLDGYRADLEESASLHSLPKETNENIVSMANIEYKEQERAENTHSDVREEASSPSISKEDIGKEMAKADESPSEIATPIDSKFPRNSLNEGANEPSLKEDGKDVVESSSNQDSGEISKKNVGMLRVESEDLISMSDDSVAELLHASDQTQVEEEEQPPDLGMNLPQQNPPTEEGKKVNWKVGYLDVKLPPKSRGKGHLKVGHFSL